jgi:uncharacterized protein YcfJ
MNRKTLVLMAVLALPAAAWADHDDRESYREYARVVDVTPLYRRVEVSVPRRECYEELERVEYRARGRDHRRSRRDASPVQTIAGGVIGGVIGRQFGDGRGRDAMTVLGTLVGAAVASEAGRDDWYEDHDRRRTHYSPARYRTVERCEVAYETRYEQQSDGYLVTYEYEGRTFTTRTATHPGRSIAVDVEVRPVRGG